MKKVSLVITDIDMLLFKTYKGFKLIINESSNGQSRETCQQILEPSVTIISQRNQGLAGARNTSAYLLWFLFQSVYSQVEALAAKITRVDKKRCILQNKSRQGIWIS